MAEGDPIVGWRFGQDIYPEEVLAAQDGKTVPLTNEPGGNVIGKVDMKYHPETGELHAEITVDDPELAAFLRGPSPVTQMSLPHIFKKESQ